MNARRMIAELARFTFDSFKPPADLDVADWADENRVLVTESSAEPGRWRTSRAPYQREIMAAFTQTGIWKIVIQASAQVGKSEVLMNMMGRAIDVDPGPMLFVQPTDAFAEDFSKRRVAPMVKACPALRRKVYEAKSRDAGNTISMKTFPGGSVSFTGANSPTELAGRPIRYLFCDEIDRFPLSAGTEGDPLALAEMRTETFSHNRKVIYASTPTIKRLSKIEREYRHGTREEWHTQCPHCGAYSFIRFENILFDKEEYLNPDGEQRVRAANARWKCPICGNETGEHDTKRLPGKWVANAPEALKEGVRSFKINAFVSPFNDWTKKCAQFLQSRNDPELLKVFTNTVLGECWEPREKSDEPEALYARRESYPAEVPNGPLILTMGVDTQDNRLEYEVVGWNENEESWGINRGIIPFRPDDDEAWREIDLLLDREWETADGRAMRVKLCFIDSGGHFTQEIYKRCLQRRHKRMYAIKGEGGEDKPYVRFMKTDKAGGSPRFIIGVDAGKEAILYATSLEKAGPRYMHFPNNPTSGYDAEFFRGLISEKMVLHRKMGQNYIVWEKVYERNEPLDIRNYARAAYKALPEYFKYDFARARKLMDDPDAAKAQPAKKRPPRSRVLSRGVEV